MNNKKLLAFLLVSGIALNSFNISAFAEKISDDDVVEPEATMYDSKGKLRPSSIKDWDLKVDYNLRDGASKEYPADNSVPIYKTNNARITRKAKQIKRVKRDQYGEEYRYNYVCTMHYIDVETNREVKSEDLMSYIDPMSFRNYTPEVTSLNLPQGYRLDYTTFYQPTVLNNGGEDVDIRILVKKNRLVRLHDKKTGDLIFSGDTNIYAPDFDDTSIPKEYKLPYMDESFSGFRLEGENFVKDMYLDRYTKDDIKPTDELSRQAKIKERVEAAEKLDEKDKQKDYEYKKNMVLKALESADPKAVEKKIEEEEKDQVSNTKEPKISKTVKMTINFRLNDDKTGEKVAEYKKVYFKNEKYTRPEAPYGYEFVKGQTFKNPYADNDYTIEMKVIRVKPIDDIIAYNNQYKGEPQITNALDGLKYTRSAILNLKDKYEPPKTEDKKDIQENKNTNIQKDKETEDKAKTSDEKDKESKANDEKKDEKSSDDKKVESQDKDKEVNKGELKTKPLDLSKITDPLPEKTMPDSVYVKFTYTNGSKIIGDRIIEVKKGNKITAPMLPNGYSLNETFNEIVADEDIFVPVEVKPTNIESKTVDMSTIKSLDTKLNESEKHLEDSNVFERILNAIKALFN